MLRATGRAIAAAARMAAKRAVTVADAAWLGIRAISDTFEWLVAVTVETVKLPFDNIGYGMDRIFGRGYPVPQPPACRAR